MDFIRLGCFLFGFISLHSIIFFLLFWLLVLFGLTILMQKKYRFNLQGVVPKNKTKKGLG